MLEVKPTGQRDHAAIRSGRHRWGISCRHHWGDSLFHLSQKFTLRGNLAGSGVSLQYKATMFVAR